MTQSLPRSTEEFTLGIRILSELSSKGEKVQGQVITTSQLKTVLTSPLLLILLHELKQLPQRACLDIT
jgi:hypothetical protein